MTDKLSNIKVEITEAYLPMEDCMSNTTSVNLPTVKVEVDYESLLCENDGIRVIKQEEADPLSGDATSSVSRTSLCASSSLFVDTSALTKEEDLEICFGEEEGSAQDSLDSFISSIDIEGSPCGVKVPPKTEMIKGSVGFNRKNALPFVESGPNVSEREKSKQGDASVFDSERPFACANCAARFRKKQYLKQHIFNHSSERPFACSQCSVQFKNMTSLRRHSVTHSSEKPYVCAHCATRFTRKDDLKRHLLIHSNERPHVCTHCAARFTQKGPLKAHLLIHSNEKPHVCTHCAARFNRKGDLKTHLRIHSNERPHVCTHCAARFTQKGHLKRHLLIHSNERPHVCTHCAARFTRKNYLKTHLLIHSNEKPHVCTH